MKVLVTGGSGFLGINLIRYLLQQGITDITSLDLVEFDYAEKNKINAVIGDIRHQHTVKQLMQGVDWVIHCAAALPLYSKEEIYSTDVQGTRIVMQEAWEQKVQRVVHISSTAVYGIPDHHPLYEDDPLIGVGPYGEAKILAEEVCLEFRQKGMCVPIIRPKSFIGPERLGVFAIFYEWARDGKNFPMIGNGKNRYQLLDVEDLCRVIYICLTDDQTRVNDIFNIGAKEFTTMKEDYMAVMNQAGHNKKIITFPDTPVIYMLRFLEMLKLSPLYKWIYETASKDSFVSVEKAEKQLKFTPQFSNKDALVRNYQWYLYNYNPAVQVTGISHRLPWKQGVLKLAKAFF
ncbi:MAG TPA: NAD-dependent epimerase/dehydratase family protein [bacterium]|nr:NAD-dependent epimerase/dehydratase family protein [bacterium]HPN43842.1 NAD-dependent epimerase/dehydratase family protein [bacterium]